MATYHLDPTKIGGNNDGTSTTNAWTSLAGAVIGANGTQPTAGDTVLMYANGSIPDEDITAIINIPLEISGTGGLFTNFVGVNSSGVQDGTRYWIKGDDVITDCLYFGAVDFTNWYNLRVGNSASYQIDFLVSGASYCHFFNLKTNGSIRMYRNSGGYIYNSLIEFETGQAGNGIYNLAGGIVNSTVRNFTGHGVNCSYSGCRVIGNLIYNNPKGIDASISNTIMLGNIIHDCGVGIEFDADYANIIRGNRITGCTTGVSCTSAGNALFSHNYLQNTTDISVATGELINPFNTETNIIGGTDTDYGYVDSAGFDFNLASGASLRSVAITPPTS